jgi:hypothetical protein
MLNDFKPIEDDPIKGDMAKLLDYGASKRVGIQRRKRLFIFLAH